MELLTKIERMVEGWLAKLKLPHLPKAVTRWIGENIWWITAVLAILSGLSVLFGLIGLLSTLAAVSAFGGWAFGALAGWVVISTVSGLVFSGVDAVIMGMAVNPLKAKQLKGWNLLFLVWVIGAVSTAVSLVLNLLGLNIVSFLFGAIFGAAFLALYGYFLFEIKHEFAHVVKSKGAKKA